MRLTFNTYQQIAGELKSDGKRERDKRRLPRVGVGGEASVVSLLDDSKNSTLHVRVRDLSRNGVGLSSPRAMTQGERFVLQLMTTLGQPRWLVCEAAHCRRQDTDRFQIGARILKVLNAEELSRAASDTQAPAKNADPKRTASSS